MELGLPEVKKEIGKINYKEINSSGTNHQKLV